MTHQERALTEIEDLDLNPDDLRFNESGKLIGSNLDYYEAKFREEDGYGDTNQHSIVSVIR